MGGEAYWVGRVFGGIFCILKFLIKKSKKKEYWKISEVLDVVAGKSMHSK